MCVDHAQWGKLAGLHPEEYENSLDFMIHVCEKISPCHHQQLFGDLASVAKLSVEEVLTIAEGTLFLGDDFFGNEDQERQREQKGREQFLSQVRRAVIANSKTFMGAS